MRYNYEKLIASIKKYLKDNKITQGGLAAQCEDSPTQGAISRYLSGEREPELAHINSLVSVIGTPITEFFIFEEGDNLKMTKQPKRYVPLISWVDAGRFKDAIDNNPIGVGEPIQYYGNDIQAFALIVDGNSMEDEFFAGDRIVVSPNAYCNNGDYCVVKIGDAAALKKLIKKGKIIILRSLNKNYDDIIITEKDKDFEVIGKVVKKEKIY